ncbi:MAG: M24 family metallopeptidase [Bacillota bacterium]
MHERINGLRELMQCEGIDSFLVTSQENRFYFTGFTGSSGSVAITQKDIFLFTDFRYDEQAKIEAPHCQIIMVKDALTDSLEDLVKEANLKKMGFEGDSVTYQQYNTLKEKLETVEIRPLPGVLDCLRSIKDDKEIDRVKKAVSLSDKAFEHILPFIKEGVSEREIALEIEFYMRKNGSEGVAFPTIVASGQRSSLPHGIASQKKIARGDLVTLDFGAVLEWYNSDITRTIAVGEKNEEQQKIYNIVLEAQLSGISSVRPGIPASEVDRAARKVIEDHGYGEFFGHSTGHGLGLKVHENPRLSAKDDTELKPGMIITVEPGIYLPGWGGVRIEDTVLVTGHGCSVLSAAPKESLIVCDQ